ncbi:unnamed protein product [Ilex paraguariensis]|uniref:G-protein coupled receptors family 2 profile 2 domain-containing protein n=1 Tax=Ilex paraguariensis TaxID=185542 RepID=A0ABC8U4F2_9AQUA
MATIPSYHLFTAFRIKSSLTIGVEVLSEIEERKSWQMGSGILCVLEKDHLFQFCAITISVELVLVVGWFGFKVYHNGTDSTEFCEIKSLVWKRMCNIINPIVLVVVGGMVCY